MYCTKCGNPLEKNADICPVCHNGMNQENQSTQQTENLRGFSIRINDPLFAKYVKNSNRWAAIFSIIIAVIAIVGFYIAGEVGNEMDNPESLFVGLGVGGMFIIIAIFQIFGRNSGKTWDGTIEDKKIKKKTERHDYGDGDVQYDKYLEYSVFVRSDRGKRYVIRTRDDDSRYNYYNIGDRIRYHGKLSTYEKYDKTGDKFIPCNACGTICDISDEYCFRCKCPLLK